MQQRATIRLAILLLCCAAPRLLAQAPAVPAAPTAIATTPEGGPQLLDSVVAIVNDDVLLESDVEEEERFGAFQPFTAATKGNPRQEALARLIDRTLVEQQMRRQAMVPVVTDEEVEKELTQLRKSLPECAKYACSTGDGWGNFCQAHGFTTAQVSARWKQRMVLLKFIEQRFKTGIRISQPEIQQYYDEKFVPRFREKGLTAPPLSAVSDRMEEILLQQRVNVLLEDWLKSLHDQGSVQILDPSLVPKVETVPDGSAPASNLPVPASAGGKSTDDGGLLQ
jgi:hypothetical protein